LHATLLNCKLSHFRKTYICNALQFDKGNQVNGVEWHPVLATPCSRPWYAAGMAEPRKRLRSRRVLLAFAAFVLLFYGYVGSYFAMWWLTGRGIVSREAALLMCESAYSPVDEYLTSGAPGATTAFRLRLWVWYHGQGNPKRWDSFSD